MTLDVDRFLRDGEPRWRALDALLGRVEAAGGRVELDDWRRLAMGYRRVASDLILAREAGLDPALLDALNALVARSHGLLHAPPPRSVGRFVGKARALLVDGFRSALRRRAVSLVLSAATLLSGILTGAVLATLDPRAVAAFVPEAFAHLPKERVAQDAVSGISAVGRTPLGSAAFLFTHNLKVTLLLFGLGLSWGLGVLLLLFYNGLLLGAMGADYAAAGQSAFFFAWVLPHGVPELAAVTLGGAAGMSLASALWLPGEAGRREALRCAAGDGLSLLAGATPWLLVAGAIESTISQLHPPRVPFALKWTVAALGVAGILLHWWGVGSRRDNEAAA